jgi:transcriptional regulator with XRE-family HTH domain
MSDIGAELKLRRILKGLLQWRVAREAEMTANRLSEIELGKRQPTEEEINRILQAIERGVIKNGNIPGR